MVTTCQANLNENLENKFQVDSWNPTNNHKSNIVLMSMKNSQSVHLNVCTKIFTANYAIPKWRQSKLNP